MEFHAIAELGRMRKYSYRQTEIPTPELVKKFHHLRDIAKEIPPLDRKAEVALLIGRDAPELMKVREVGNGPIGTP